MHPMEIPHLRLRVLIVIAGLCTILLIWAVDYYLTAPAFTLTLAYLFPIAIVAWYAGQNSGISLAVVSSMAWFSVYATHTPHFLYSFLAYLNLATKLILYLAFAIIMAKLKRSLARERELSRIDYLTGAVNRRSFEEALNIEINRARRKKNPVTIAFIDVDNFKYVNDTFGHSKGDQLLHLTSETIREHIRITDTLARIGGDEFAILLPEQDYDSAEVAIQKVRHYLQEMTKNLGLPVTFSIGVATCLSPPVFAEDQINLADTLMYEAKQSGKNRIRHVAFKSCGRTSPSEITLENPGIASGQVK